ncbi:MAG: acyloxyacyl hydrolase [Bacteroidota bacterium]|nr:acyloxyacyl hydrolase [Bacteroidota bacterium]
MKINSGIITTIISLYFCTSIYADPIFNTDSSTNNMFSVSIQQHYGFIIIHSTEIRAIKNSYPTGTELNFNWQKMDQKSWNLCYCYPRAGVLISFFDFDNKSILGYGYNIAGFIEPFFPINKKLNISFRLASGLSFNTNPYDSIENPNNLSYSLPINEYSQLAASLHYSVNPKLRIILSANYNHISNGGLKQPNKGINYPTASIGIDYIPKPTSFQNRIKKTYAGVKKRRYNLSAFYFPKKIIENDKYFTVFGLSTGVSKQVGRISAVTADLEWVWDGTLKWETQNLNKTEDYQRGAFLIGHEFLMGRITFSQKIGIYIYDYLKYNDPIYQKYGINFYLTQNLFTGIHIKAHRHVADFMQVQLGYSF